MEERVELKKWQYANNQYVQLMYKDNDNLYVSKKDFDRAFGAIVTASKSDIQRDFAVDPEVVRSFSNSQAPAQSHGQGMSM